MARFCKLHVVGHPLEGKPNSREEVDAVRLKVEAKINRAPEGAKAPEFDVGAPGDWIVTKDGEQAFVKDAEFRATFAPMDGYAKSLLAG